MRHWPHGQRWFISLMKEAEYPILYHFNLSLGVSSHLAPDVIHKNSRVSVILQHPWTWPRPLAQSYFRAFMHLAWRITLKAPLEPKLGLPIEPSGAVLNGFLVGGGVFIGWSSWSSVNSLLLDWGAEEEAASASGNESKSVRATTIDQSFWDLFSKLIIVDTLDQRMVNRRLEDSKGTSQVPLSLIETAQLSSFFTKGKRAPTRAPASTRSGHFNSLVVLKVFCSFSSKQAGWPVGCGAFRIIKRLT